MSIRFSLMFTVNILFLFTLAHTEVKTAFGEPIPDKKVLDLNKDLIKALKDTKSSSVRKRRTFKDLITKGESLIKAHPSAFNRFVVLEIILKSQIQLLRLQKTERNREAILETSTRLSEAPDEFAELKFNAEVLLTEKKLAEKESGYEDHAIALAEIIDRYQGSSAEARILMKGVTMAASLNAYELKDRLIDRLDDEFMHDDEVIEFRRQTSSTSLRASFQNQFLRIDGTELCFPQDTGGKVCVFAFWSMENPSIDLILGYLKDLQAKHPETLHVFSLNLDNLPDGGKSKLDELGLDWQVLPLPEGRESKAYTTYARTDPAFVLVDVYGYTLLKPRTEKKWHPPKKGKVKKFSIPDHLKLNESFLSLGRFLNQLQSINIGDFLVQGSSDTFSPSHPPEIMMISNHHVLSELKTSATPVSSKIPHSEFKKLQDCFPVPPFRYRLPPSKALENYRKAETLAQNATKKYANDPGVWMLRNRRMIALLGMWQVALEPKYLKQAAEEARVSLETELIRGAEVVPYFCLAKEALRLGEEKPEEVLANFIKNTGGAEAPASAIAAAATLALFNIRKEELRETYRESALASANYGNPLLWPVRSFLLDRCNDFFFSGHSIGHWRNARSHLINHNYEPLTSPFPELSLKDLDGKPLKLPTDTSDAQTLLLFIEPPQDSNENFPEFIDSDGKPTGGDYIRSTMSLAERLHAQRTTKNINVIVAFLCDDPTQVRHLMEKNQWTVKAAMLPGGLNSPMITRLNILSADRLPNAFLIRRNGTISWSMSGLKYGERNNVFMVELALRAHFERNEVEWGHNALAKGDFKEAITSLAGPFPKNLTNRYAWRGPRKHGLTLAHIRNEDWASANLSVDDAIFEHMARHSHGIPRPRRASIEEKSQFGEKVLKEKPCDIISELWSLKALILNKLERYEEAKVFQELADKPCGEDEDNVYNTLHYSFIELNSKEK